MMLGFIFRTQSPVEELEVVFSREECILCRHPYTSDDVILNQTAQGLAGRRNKVLIVSVGDVVRLRARDLVLCNVPLDVAANRDKDTHTREMDIHF